MAEFMPHFAPVVILGLGGCQLQLPDSNGIIKIAKAP